MSNCSNGYMANNNNETSTSTGWDGAPIEFGDLATFVCRRGMKFEEDPDILNVQYECQVGKWKLRSKVRRKSDKQNYLQKSGMKGKQLESLHGDIKNNWNVFFILQSKIYTFILNDIRKTVSMSEWICDWGTNTFIEWSVGVWYHRCLIQSLSNKQHLFSMRLIKKDYFPIVQAFLRIEIIQILTISGRHKAEFRERFLQSPALSSKMAKLCWR